MHILFRKEAIQALHKNEQGEILLSKRFNIIYVLLALLTICLITAICILEYSRHITITGTLKSIGGAVKVFARDPGIVADIYITEGQYVVQNQELVMVRLPAHLYQMNQNKRDSLQQQIERNLERAKKTKKQNELTTSFTASQLQLLKREQEQIEVSISIQKQQVSLGQEQLTKARLLKNKASLSQRQLESYEENLHSAQLQLQRLILSYQNKNTQLAAIHKEIHLTQINYELQQDELVKQNQDYKQAMNRLKEQSEYTIRAPVSGIATNVQMLTGQQTDSAKPILYVLADETEYYAELFFPSRHIGFLSTNIPVKLKMDAYPYQQYGMADGVIKEVSKTTMNYREVNGLFNSTESMYRVRVSLVNQHLNYKDRPLNLMDGMKVTAERNLESRRLLYWLISPLYEFSQDV